MAYREVTMLEIKEVLRQWLAGEGIRCIARRVGVARNTVRHYVEVATACGLTRDGGAETLTEELLAEVVRRLDQRHEQPRGESWVRCEEQREFIARRLDDGLRLTKVRKLLGRTGVEVPYATLHRYASIELGFGRGTPTIPVADCKPGKELQLDTGWMGNLEPDEQGVRRRFRAWIFTSVFSRHRFVYPCFRETTADAIEACEAAWRFFGGVFEVLIPDNTKAIVKEPDPLSPLIVTAFLEYAQARGFVIDPARVRHPQDKGRVERAVRPTRDDCFAGEHLHTIEASRCHAVGWCLRDYGMRRHTRTQRLPLEYFEAEERAHLLPEPTTVYEVPLWCEPKVARDQHAQVAKALYSLPRRFVGTYLQARADRMTVRFYDGALLVKTHPRKAPGERSTDPADFPSERAAYALRDIAFLERQAGTHGEAVGHFARRLLEGPLPWTRMRRVYSLLGLCRRYGSERVAEVCGQALAVDMLDVRRLRRMLERGSHPALSAAPRPSAIPQCRYLRPAHQYALPLTGGEQARSDHHHDEGDDR
jgi:transposase